MEKGFEYQLHTLPSGLRLVTIPMPAATTATVLVLVKCGSKYETKDLSGISHFLEHMMFKGTQQRRVFGYQQRVDASCQLQGFTSKELRDTSQRRGYETDTSWMWV